MAKPNATFSISQEALDELNEMCGKDSKSHMIEALIHCAYANHTEIKLRQKAGDEI